MVFTIPQFFFAFISAFSGQSVFDDWYITLYNLVFTCFPLLIRGIFDQDIYFKYQVPQKNNEILIKESSKVKDEYSNLYFMSQNNLLFTKLRFSLFLIEGLLNGLFIFLIHYFTMNEIILNSSGYNGDFWIFSISMFTSIVFIANMKLAIITQNWTILNWIALLGTSLATYFIYIWISDNLPIDIADTAVILFISPSFYLCLFICVLPFFSFQLFYYSFISPRPALINILRNLLEKDKNQKETGEIKEMKGMEMSKKINNENTDISFEVSNRLNRKLL
jgi:phospholipid-translocating ATPase